MSKSYKIVNPEVTKKDIWLGNTPIGHSNFIKVVESFSWLTWVENTDLAREFYIKNADLPRKRSAYFNLDNDYKIEISYVDDFCTVYFDKVVTYEKLILFFDFATKLGCNMWDRDTLEIVDEEYLEALRIKEENRGIKLTNEQSHVLTLVEEQCRWYHIPSDDQEKILQCFPATPKFREAEITEVIEDIQFENLIGMATIPGHTLLFGFHLPYINYADEADYKACADHTARLKDILNRLSKAFGSAEFYEYREEDPDMMRMVLSKKGKFAYASLFAEGEFDEEFGTSKRTISSDAKTYWKTVKKWGMAPADLLTYMMKQKLPVKVFRQDMYWKWASEGN